MLDTDKVCIDTYQTCDTVFIDTDVGHIRLVTQMLDMRMKLYMYYRK